MSASRVWLVATRMARVIGANVAFALPAEAAVTCGGEQATIVGTKGSNTLVGTLGHDVIVGGAGADTIDARGGHDVICGNQGTDVLSGGPGRDLILGGLDGPFKESGVHTLGDTLSGGVGDDHLVPGYHRYRHTGRVRDLLSWESSPQGVHIDLARGVATGQGHDTFATTPVRVWGSDFDDLIDGSSRADVIFAYLGSDEVHAGAGDDRVEVESERPPDTALPTLPTPPEQPNDADVVYAGAGRDRIGATHGSDTLHGGDGADRIRALSEGDDSDRTFAGRGDD